MVKFFGMYYSIDEYQRVKSMLDGSLQKAGTRLLPTSKSVDAAAIWEKERCILWLLATELLLLQANAASKVQVRVARWLLAVEVSGF